MLSFEFLDGKINRKSPRQQPFNAMTDQGSMSINGADFWNGELPVYLNAFRGSISHLISHI